MSRYEVVTAPYVERQGTDYSRQSSNYITANNDNELRSKIRDITKNWRVFVKCYEISSENPEFKRQYDPYKTRNEEGYIINVEATVKRAMGDDFSKVRAPYGHTKKFWLKTDNNGNASYSFDIMGDVHKEFDSYSIPQSILLEDVETLKQFIKDMRIEKIQDEIDRLKSTIEILESKKRDLKSI